MGKATSKSRLIPIIPLPKGQVLLPGISLRISVVNRPDVAALLARLYSTTTSRGTTDASVTVACVPLGSPYLAPDGKRLITKEGEEKQITEDVHPAVARAGDLFGLGCVARVSGVQQARGNGLSLIVEGTERCRVESVVKERPFFEAYVRPIEEQEVDADDPRVQQQFGELKQLSREFLALIRLSSLLPRPPSVQLTPLLARRLELFIARKDVQDAGSLSDFMANIIDCTHDDKLLILAAMRTQERLERVIEILQKQITNLQGNGRMGMTITSAGAPTYGSEMEKWISAIKNNALGGPRGPPGGLNGMPGGAGGEDQNELDELKKRLDDAKLTPEAMKVAMRELGRLQKMNPAMAEYQVCRNYLENLAEIPWSKLTEDNLDGSVIVRARKQLDDDHYGLEKIKKRLLEYLAVLKLKAQVYADLEGQLQSMVAAAKDVKSVEEELSDVKKEELSEKEQTIREKQRKIDKAPILLLVGPPGTGKTSLAKSIATALGRKFHRISLGGVRDEAEVRGHRRTYVAAMPGLIVNGLKKVGVSNPVFLLDELDKLGHANFQGDPSAAMLEVLDPEQNHTFVDHYVNIPLDLSKILFIATANSLDTIPPPLLDRMETIQLSGYTTLEKRHIAMRHLLPKQVLSNGLQAHNVELSAELLDQIITGYTREAGVRNLEREIGSVCRFKAVEFAEAQGAEPAPSSSSTVPAAKYNPTVALSDLEEILGPVRYDEELTSQTSRPGVVTGLVAYSTGGQGSILFIEALDMPGRGTLKLTGKLGDVLRESVEVALSWVRSHAFELGLTQVEDEDVMEKRGVHIHCPSGAVPKDGPSAGLAHTIALVSLFGARPVPPSVAMTGEISLRGKVLPVGGVREKLIGALRAGVKTVIIPERNRRDLKEVPAEVKRGMRIVCVGHVGDALRVVWPDGRWPADGAWAGGFEGRL